MDQHFYNGFIKRAQDYGLSVVEATNLLKQANQYFHYLHTEGLNPKAYNHVLDTAKDEANLRAEIIKNMLHGNKGHRVSLGSSRNILENTADDLQTSKKLSKKEKDNIYTGGTWEGNVSPSLFNRLFKGHKKHNAQFINISQLPSEESELDAKKKLLAKAVVGVTSDGKLQDWYRDFLLEESPYLFINNKEYTRPKGKKYQRN